MGTIETMATRQTTESRQGASFVRVLTLVAKESAARIARYLERRRSRRALMELDDDMLKDIGISRADAYREGIRAFWE